MERRRSISKSVLAVATAAAIVTQTLTPTQEHRYHRWLAHLSARLKA